MSVRFSFTLDTADEGRRPMRAVVPPDAYSGDALTSAERIADMTHGYGTKAT